MREVKKDIAREEAENENAKEEKTHAEGAGMEDEQRKEMRRE